MPSYNSVLEEIKSRLDIVDVISEYVPLKKAGQNWRGLCPFHSEKTPSFMVSPIKQIYHCFGCGNGGDIFSFLVNYENLSFQEALRVLAKKAGVTLKESQRRSMTAGDKDILLGLHRDAIVFYQKYLMKNTRAGNYLRKRGLTADAQKLFSVGYAPKDWDALLSYLKKKGYKAEVIKKAGLIARGTKDYYDIFRDRIIFPIFDQRGEPVAFGGRVMDDSMPKYLNSPETPIFNKSRTLYGLNLAKEHIKNMGYAIFVEGYIDVITAHMHGFSNTVGPLGTALTPEQGKIIKRFTQKAVLVFDGDAPGLKAAKSGIGILLENGFEVKALILPEGEDPDSILSKKKGKEIFAGLLNKARPVIDFFVMQKGDRYSLCNEALETISRIPNSIIRGDHVRQLAEKFNEADIREELMKIMKKQSRSGRLSIQRQTGVSKPKPGAVNRDEAHLFQLILQFPDMAEKVFNALPEEDFGEGIARNIYKKMRSGVVDYNELRSVCDQDEEIFLRELWIETESEHPGKMLSDCIKSLKSRKLRILVHKIDTEMKKAEQEKNKDRVMELMHKKQQLLKLERVSGK